MLKSKFIVMNRKLKIAGVIFFMVVLVGGMLAIHNIATKPKSYTITKTQIQKVPTYIMIPTTTSTSTSTTSTTVDVGTSPPIYRTQGTTGRIYNPPATGQAKKKSGHH